MAAAQRQCDALQADAARLQRQLEASKEQFVDLRISQALYEVHYSPLVDVTAALTPPGRSLPQGQTRSCRCVRPLHCACTQRQVALLLVLLLCAIAPLMRALVQLRQERAEKEQLRRQTEALEEALAAATHQADRDQREARGASDFVPRGSNMTPWRCVAAGGSSAAGITGPRGSAGGRGAAIVRHTIRAAASARHCSGAGMVTCCWPNLTHPT